jgi:deoxycytidylate deaminase
LILPKHLFKLTTDSRWVEPLIRTYRCAKEFSTDRSTQNCAQIVAEDGSYVASACNVVPEGVQPLESRYSRPEAYYYTIHAEQHVLHSLNQHCWRNGVVYLPKSLTMVVPMYACSDCAKNIVADGRIKRIVGHHQATLLMGDRWTESTIAGLTMMREAGIECMFYDGLLHYDASILINGGKFNPSRDMVYIEEDDSGRESF